ncbi:hypothetical protein VTN00DRAFT_8911 [Thermoascus crustaceus]|uniref:uncharacterized protein n=1 Tax=Thermoascus crustaceus TaxID=5088 RepID=UPI00374238C4
MPSVQTTRRIILTAAVTTTTIAGTLYGAGLKTEQEIKQTSQKRQEATIDDRIESLQTMRNNLLSKKNTVEKQIRDLDARIKEKKRKGIVGAGSAGGERSDGR